MARDSDSACKGGWQQLSVLARLWGGVAWWARLQAPTPVSFLIVPVWGGICLHSAVAHILA